MCILHNLIWYVFFLSGHFYFMLLSNKYWIKCITAKCHCKINTSNFDIKIKVLLNRFCLFFEIMITNKFYSLKLIISGCLVTRYVKMNWCCQLVFHQQQARYNFYRKRKRNNVISSRWKSWSSGVLLIPSYVLLDYASSDKNRQKLLLSSRDWDTLATEYDN